MGEQYSIREYVPDDKSGLFRLNEAVWGKPFGEHEWKWKFERGPVRNAWILIAESGGSIVGLRAFLVRKIKVFEKVMLSGLGVDVMVHQDFRKFGIASKMADQAFPRMEAQGIPILIGFPNDAAFQVYKKNRPHWRHVCSVPFLVKPLRIGELVDIRIGNPFLKAVAKPLLKVFAGLFLRNRLKSLRGLEVRKVDRVDERFDLFWENVSSQFNMMQVRDRAFLQWRYVDKPESDNVIFAVERGKELRGYIVLSRASLMGFDLGLIVDVMALDDDASSELLGKAMEHFEESGVSLIGSLMLRHASYYKLMKRAGFTVAPTKLTNKEFYFGVQVKPGAVADNLVNRPENWFITFSDTDIA